MVKLLEIGCRFWKWIAHLKHRIFSVLDGRNPPIQKYSESQSFIRIRKCTILFRIHVMGKRSCGNQEDGLWSFVALGAYVANQKSSPPVFGANPLHSMALSSPPHPISPISHRARGGKGWNPRPVFHTGGKGFFFCCPKAWLQGKQVLDFPFEGCSVLVASIETAKFGSEEAFSFAPRR